MLSDTINCIGFELLGGICSSGAFGGFGETFLTAMLGTFRTVFCGGGFKSAIFDITPLFQLISQKLF